LELSDFILKALPIPVLELITVITGFFYLKKATNAIKNTKYLVIFLLITFIVDLIGSYAAIGYFSNYSYFGFVENTPFRRNAWLFNSFMIISFSFYIFYFKSFLGNKKWKLILKVLTILFITSSIINLLFTDIFFNGSSKFTTIIGTLLLFLSVALFYFELLRSDVILKLKQFLPLYISIGILIFHLCVTPIDIFSKYFDMPSGNEVFVNLKASVLLYVNIFMYLLFTFGFIICSRTNKSS